MTTSSGFLTNFPYGVGEGAVPNAVTGSTSTQIQGPMRLALDAAAAASATYYINAHSADGSTVTVNKAPDYARNVQIVASGADTSNVVIHGLDANGYAISETLALNGTTPVVGKKAYSKITTVVLPTTAATTVSVGTDVTFGFPYRVTENTLILQLVDGAPDTAGTFAAGSTTAGDDYYGTWISNTAPNGTHDLVCYYIPTDLTSYGVNN